LEHDDMASERPSEKPDATASKPARDPRSPSPPSQIPSPLSNDGPELLRDNNC
jgi:hypothetical protein